jgi:hypothetical protein
MIYYTLDRKLKIEHHEQHWKQYDDLLYTRHKTKDRATRRALKTIKWSTKHYTETKDWATRTPLKTNNDLQNTTQKPKTEQHELH